MRRAGAAVASLVALAFPLLGAASGAGAASASAAMPQVVIVNVGDIGFADLLASSPQVRALASVGGAALVSSRVPLTLSGGDRFVRWIPVTGSPSVGATWTALRGILSREGSGAVVVMIFAPLPAPSDVVGGDELGSLVMAAGSGTGLSQVMAAAAGPPHALTSDSTHQAGVVTTGDVVTTLAALRGVTAPAGFGGSVIRRVAVPAPLTLYQRYRGQRRLTVPIGAAAGIYVALVGLLGALVLVRADRASNRLRWLSAAAVVSVVPLAVALLEVGRLPSLTYAGVVPFLAALTLAGTVAVMVAAGRVGALVALWWLGVATLAILLVEAVTGWHAAVTPLLGGSQLDGGRFYGMPNVEVGLVLGAACYVSHRLRATWEGVALLAACGLVAGSPWTGSNVGAAITLFAAAGLWWGLRDGRGWLRTIGAAALVTVAGLALVVVAHRYLTAVPTHISHFTEASGGLAGIARKFWNRLGVGFRLIADNPVAVVPVLGVPAVLAVIYHAPASVRVTFEAHPAWRAALLTIAWGSIGAYIANDSGASALGLGFGTALAGLLYVSLLASRGMMEP